MIHPVIIFIAKVLIDAIPGMTQDVSWTIVNLGYMAVSARVELKYRRLTPLSVLSSCSTT